MTVIAAKLGTYLRLGREKLPNQLVELNISFIGSLPVSTIAENSLGGFSVNANIHNNVFFRNQRDKV